MRRARRATTRCPRRRRPSASSSCRRRRAAAPDRGHGAAGWRDPLERVRMADLQPGDVFAGHRIEGLAGRGGMGVVYRATELTLDRVVALKLIPPALAGDPDFRARFLRESRAAASIEHPNVLPIYYAGELD